MHTLASPELAKAPPYWESRLFASTAQRRLRLNVPDGSNVTGEQLRKRRERIKKWEDFAFVATHLPAPAGAEALGFLKWLAGHKILMETESGDVPHSAWAEFARKIEKLCAVSVGRSSADGLSTMGFQALRNLLYQIVAASNSDTSPKRKKDRTHNSGENSCGVKDRREGGHAIHDARGLQGRTRSGDKMSGSSKGEEGSRVMLPSLKISGRQSAGMRDTGMLSADLNQTDDSVKQLGQVHAMLRKGWRDSWVRKEVLSAQNKQWKGLYDDKNDLRRILGEKSKKIASMKTYAIAEEEIRRAKFDSLAMMKFSPGGMGGDQEGRKSPLLSREEMKNMRALVKSLQRSLQLKFNNTRTLPQDLFKAFLRYDKDKSGGIEYSEFEDVCEEIGLGTGVLSDQDRRTLFAQCDKDRSGYVDFGEFLKSLVGNIVHSNHR